MASADKLPETLKRLRLFGLLARIEEVRNKPWLEEVVAIELEEKTRRSLAHRQHLAGIGAFKPVCSFDWKWPRKIDRSLIEELFTLSFIAEGTNVVLLGPNGVGKTMLLGNLADRALRVVGGSRGSHDRRRPRRSEPRPFVIGSTRQPSAIRGDRRHHDDVQRSAASGWLEYEVPASSEAHSAERVLEEVLGQKREPRPDDRERLPEYPARRDEGGAPEVPARARRDGRRRGPRYVRARDVHRRRAERAHARRGDAVRREVPGALPAALRDVLSHARDRAPAFERETAATSRRRVRRRLGERSPPRSPLAHPR